MNCNWHHRMIEEAIVCLPLQKYQKGGISLKKKRFALLSFATAFMLLLGGCFSGETESKPDSSDGEKSGEEQSDGKKVLNLNNKEEPGSLHPGTAQGTHDSWSWSMFLKD